MSDNLEVSRHYRW